MWRPKILGLHMRPKIKEERREVMSPELIWPKIKEGGEGRRKGGIRAWK